MIAILLMHQVVAAKFYTIKHSKQLQEALNKHEFSVVCFTGNIDEQMDKDDQKNMKKKMHSLHHKIKSIAEQEQYKKLLKQEVAFIVLDDQYDDIDAFAQDYGIKLQQAARIMLFKHDQAITDIAGSVAMLKGFVAQSDIINFIDEYVGKDFDGILQEKADAQAAEHEEQMARYQAFAASRYPYGGYAPYNVWGSPSGSIYTGYAAFYPYGYSYNGYAYMTAPNP